MIFDQVRADILYRLISSGKMPYLKKYIFDRAAVVNNCFTCLPTNTVPGHLAILTGNYADKHHLHAMKLWNLSQMRFRDYSGLRFFRLQEEEYNPKIKMIYEFFPHSEAFTITPFAKGASFTYLTKSRTIFYYLIAKIDHKPALIQSSKTFLNHFKRNLSKNFLDCCYVLWLPISDLIGHNKGPTSNEFKLHLQEIDHTIFRTLFEGNRRWPGLKNLELLDSMYFIITADHGGFPVQLESELIHDLKKLPLRIKNRQASLKNLNRCDLLIAYTDGFANLYVKNPVTKNWNDKVQYSQLLKYPTSDGPTNLIEFFLKIPTISHIFVKNSELKVPTYLVFSENGISQIRRKKQDRKMMISYEVLSGNDPFNYGEHVKMNSLTDGTFHPFDDWLNPLGTTNYPMVLDQIPRIFDCETAGDVLFMGVEGCSFAKQRKKGTHDTGTAICTRVPLIMAGPSIKHITVPTARTVDIIPTILSLLKKTYKSSQFAGKVISEIIKS